MSDGGGRREGINLFEFNHCSAVGIMYCLHFPRLVARIHSFATSNSFLFFALSHMLALCVSDPSLLPSLVFMYYHYHEAHCRILFRYRGVQQHHIFYSLELESVINQIN